MPMKLGIVPINVGFTAPAQVTAIAQKAEQVGLESVWTFEHVIVPADYESTYPYASSGKMGATPQTPFLDPLIALAHVAAVTSTLKIGTSVNILPQTNPLLAAKQVASLDVLSGGRLLYGVGVGWLEEEFTAMGTPFARRGKRFDDYLVAMKKVWAGGTVEHESDFLKWSGFESHPLPAQRPHPPILVGGTSDAALRRVAHHGDGWVAPNAGVGPLKDLLERLRRIAEAEGRDFDSIEITSMWVYVKEPDALAEYEDLGVSRLLVPLLATGLEPMAGVEMLGKIAAG